MKIRLIEHASRRAEERGASMHEIRSVLVEGHPVPAKRGRMAKELAFAFEGEWLGRVYPQKKVLVIFVEEAGEIVVITVKVYYGCWR